MVMRFSSCSFLNYPCRFDTLSDGLEDVAVDNYMNKQTTLEDEEALDPIDDIWQEDDNSVPDEVSKYRSKCERNKLTRPYVAYEPLKSNCDSLKTWSVIRS